MAVRRRRKFLHVYNRDAPSLFSLRYRIVFLLLILVFAGSPLACGSRREGWEVSEPFCFVFYNISPVVAQNNGGGDGGGRRKGRTVYLNRKGLIATLLESDTGLHLQE